MTCIYSTLNFVANQAKRYDITAILTFDQPLYWKALSIVENENPGSTLKSMVLRLGPFHTEMSFLGSIGNLMSNTGLREMLELIYAPNAVTHILSGKAVARAFRGHMLVDTALYCLLIADIFNIDVSKLLEEPNSTLETTEMKEIDELCSQLSSGELSASEAGESDVLKNLEAMNSLFDDLIGMMLKLKGSGHGEQGNTSIQKDTRAFSSYFTSAHTASANAIVKFDKLWTNTMNAYEVTTGVFTAPMPGLYYFAAVLMSVSAKSLFLHLWHNDTNTGGSFTIGDGHKTGTFDVVFNLKKGDRIYISCSSSCNGQKIYSSNNDYSTFSGYLIAK